MIGKSKNDVLVVLLKDLSDFTIVKEEFWYRIPTDVRIPKNLQDKTVKYLAFYFPKKFDDLKCSIRYFSKITHIQIVHRTEIFPNEHPNKKSNRQYYKISFEPLQTLKKPILSHQNRFLIFVPTTFEKLMQAEELNDIFNESSLEDKLWQELKKHNLLAERQYFVRTGNKNWICDFVFFCKKGAIDVECDGDEYHMGYEAVNYDKTRNNEIEAVANWNVLRFTTRHLQEEMDWVIQIIQQKIYHLGGLSMK